MSTLSLTRLAAAAAGLALSLTTGVAVAAAVPDLSPAVTTTCNYSQVVAAMNAQSPEAAEQFVATPIAQAFLQNFLAAPTAQRQQMLEQVQAIPEAQQYVGLFAPLAETCGKY